MTRIAVVTGGSGFIGRFLIRDLLSQGEFDRVVNIDLRQPVKPEPDEEVVIADLRRPLSLDLGYFQAELSWIFNLAAACREPGFEPREYFDINVNSAEHVTGWAESIGIRNIFFTSTMSSYGRMLQPTPEMARQYPETPYGVSKTIAEKIHRIWLERGSERRLIICRPSVIFGPGDKENIPRMIKAVKKGYFLFPGDPDIVKGYGYVYGLIASIGFIRRQEGRLIIYNYAERECLSLRGMVKTIAAALPGGRSVRIIRLPMGLLVTAAYGFQLLSRLLGKTSPIHPVRVRKVAFPTNLKPQYLIETGFEFEYPLETALEHWKKVAPDDF